MNLRIRSHMHVENREIIPNLWRPTQWANCQIQGARWNPSFQVRTARRPQDPGPLSWRNAGNSSKSLHWLTHDHEGGCPADQGAGRNNVQVSKGLHVLRHVGERHNQTDARLHTSMTRGSAPRRADTPSPSWEDTSKISSMPTSSLTTVSPVQAWDQWLPTPSILGAVRR